MKSRVPSVRWTTGRCPTGKREHSDRRSAKAHARALVGQHLRPYLCRDCGTWHVGHLPGSVIRGLSTADEHYGRSSA